MFSRGGESYRVNLSDSAVADVSSPSSPSGLPRAVPGMPSVAAAVAGRCVWQRASWFLSMRFMFHRVGVVCNLHIENEWIAVRIAAFAYHSRTSPISIGSSTSASGTIRGALR